MKKEGVAVGPNRNKQGRQRSACSCSQPVLEARCPAACQKKNQTAANGVGERYGQGKCRCHSEVIGDLGPQVGQLGQIGINVLAEVVIVNRLTRVPHVECRKECRTP